MHNEMMHRPVVKPAVLDFLRQGTTQLTGALGELEQQAHEKGVPVIPHETVTFMQTLFNLKKPQTVLEVGTAIGFSASLFATCMGATGRVTSIDRYPLMLEHAKENIAHLGLEGQIKLLAGDAADILPTLTPSYDLIFMDSAKAKYLDFLDDCLRLLAADGVLLIDDVLQGGTVFADAATIPHRNKAIYRKLNQLLTRVFNDSTLVATLLPLGDGVLMITKK
ncbi:O-methyltransferase [Loigolactobacillus coryniformis]|jgi:predicted O-methyltransferase YrrM|uniref:tRNA 5-hydroxyuridine methyltransferase n=1 Tax=Loigolactobacillus coryniformis subsp. torquens DSM 20004 = KCTC 3535 TaxID=1423822 RepID=A0A2D1KL97_9LACO|nr:O-methyltransferase [Loigolactobacillus coryniformis]ATO42903.1 methyltransferase [Loigolactobacillus coryniformis subsp. torquens DSM 20004 = KCTC 3535]KRK78852.1 O-methyltransferase family protein [Loigolactobacillus coryniformis subsp. torquens DSM 20004 = KCTC 3535]